MDPNANLNEQRRLAGRITNGPTTQLQAADAFRLAELVVALDEWLSNGGFKPSEWTRRPGT